MSGKRNFCFYITVCLLLLMATPAAMAITIEQLADICETMESAIRHISLEYEWYNIPPWTIEEAEAEMGTEMLAVKDGIRRLKLTAAGLLSNRDPNDLRPLPDRVLLEDSATIMNKNGDTWDSLTKVCYNGKITKHLQVGGWPRAVRRGVVSGGRRFVPTLVLSPLGFSILRLTISKGTNKVPLSIMLRRKELVRLDTNVEKVNGFNTIRADLLQEMTRQVCMRIYFSVDHGYTPIRYEHGRFEMPEPDCLAFEVHSLEQVADGLWFPSSGIIRSSGEERSDGFQTIGKIVVNQGLGEKDFDIEFPPGTKVRDEIKDIEYVVKSQ